MSVLKLSKKDIIVNNNDDNKIKLKRNQLSFDSAKVSGWETTNKSAIETLNSYNKRVQNNEYLTADDIALYNKAVEDYISSTNNLRWLNTTFGKGYTEDEEKSWTDNITNLQSGAGNIAKFYSSFASEDDFTKYTNYNTSYDSYLKASKEDSNAGKSGYEQFIKDKEATAKAKADETSTWGHPSRDVNGDGETKWWENILYYLSGGNGGGVVDTTLPTHLSTQLIHDIRAYGLPLDTSTWTDEQKALFGYVYESDPSKALAIGDYINNLNHDEAIQEIFNSASMKDSGLAVLGSLTGIVDYMRDLTIGNATGEFKTDGKVTPFEYSQAIIGGNTQHLNDKYGTLDEDIPVFGGKGVGDIYGLGTSIAQSALAGATGSSIVMLGGSAAASGVDDALARGATEGQAAAYGGLVGLAEGVAEKLKTDELFDILFNKGASSTLKGVFKGIAKNAFSEGLEEGATSIVDGFADMLIMKDKSNLNILVEKYISEGMSESEAKKKAWLQFAGDVAFDMIAGAASGGIHAGAGFAFTAPINSAIANSDAKSIYSGANPELIAEGLEMPKDSEAYRLAEKYSNITNSGKTLSGSQIRQLVKAIEDQKTTSQENVQTNPEVNNELQQLANEVSGVTESTPPLSNAEIEKRASAAMDEFNASNSTYRARFETEQAKMFPMEEFSSTTQTTPTQAYTVSTDGKTIRLDNGEEINIKGIESNNNGQLKLRLDNDEVIDAKDVSFATKEEGLLYDMVADLGVGLDTAKSIMDIFGKGTTSIESYRANAPLAYKYGKINYDKGLAELNLSKGQKSSLFDLGRKDAGLNVEARVEANKNKTVKKNVSQKGKVKKNGITYEGDDITKGKLTPFHKANIRGAEFVAQISNLDVHVYKSFKENGKIYATIDGVKQEADNGYFVIGTNQIYLDINAGKAQEGFMLYAMSHEVGHYIREWNAKAFKELGDFIFEHYNDTVDSVDELIKTEIEKRKAAYKAEGKELPSNSQLFDEAYEEVVCDALSKMFADSNAYTVLAELKKQNKTLWQKLGEAIKKLLDKIKKVIGVYSDQTPNANSASLTEGFDRKTFKKLQEMYIKAFVEADENFASAQLLDGMIQIDAETQSVSPSVLNSERTWTESEYVQKRDEAAKEIAKTLGVSLRKALSYIDDINSIAKMIADDRTRLDYKASLFGSAFVSNVEYGGSFDFTTLCKKRRIYTGTFSEIQKRLRNTALTPDDILKIRNMLIEAHYEATCGLCYVEGSRANMGKFAKEFIRLYKRDNPNAWIPDMADVNTPDGVESMRINHPEAYEQYEYYWNHYGKLKDSDPALFASQQKPKLYEARKEYKGEILKEFTKDDTVEKKNRNGGIRMQSFSDFEIVHLIDTMQIIMDMARVGLAGQAYTKVPEFAESFGNTGLKINLSLIAKGVDSNGKLIFDDREGMPHETAFNLRKKYSKDVGTVLVTFTDEQLLAAMADPRIDYIIPFHRSQWKQDQYAAMGLPKGTKDYTNQQNEKLIKKTYHEYRGKMVEDKASNYMPNEYWDFSKSGKENAEAYLKMCAENNKRPKFYKLLDHDGNGVYSLKKDGSTDGYWKLLIDFKMYDNNGVGSPQQAVTPNFSMDEATRILGEYKGGHQSYPVAHDVVDKFVEEYENKSSNSEKKYSKRDSDGNTLTAEQQEFFKDSKVRDKDGNLMVVYHGSLSKFTEFKHSKIGRNGTSLGKGFYFTENIDMASSYYKEGGQILKGYLDIKKPLSDGKKTIKKVELGKLIKAICETQAKYMVEVDGYDTIQDAIKDTFISNYVNTYEMSLVNAYRITTDKIYPSCDTDSDIIGELINGGGGASRVLGEVRKVLGYDGVIYEHSKDRHEYVAFESNQFKNADNKTPTSNPDIRYSKRDSDGNELSKEQQEFFKDSKIRDESGNLMVVYHGTPNSGFFSVFEGDKLDNSARTSQIGQGFYFTNDKKVAQAYTKNQDIYTGKLSAGRNPYLYETYLNITNPFDVNKDTLDADKAKAVFMDGTYEWFFNNHIPFQLAAETINGQIYSQKMIQGMSKEEKVSLYVDYLMPLGSKEVLSNMVRAFGYEKQGELLASMKKRLGYDGILEEFKKGVYQYVAFDSNQIKLTTNKTPTSNPDIRYSKREILPDFDSFDSWFDSLSLEELNELINDDTSIGDISEEVNVNPKKIEILIRRKGLGESHIEENRTAVMKLSRIDEAIEDSGAKFSPDYARKYITRISTKDFIDLTVSKNHLDRETFDTEVRGDHDGTMSDFNYEQALQDGQSPYLHIDKTTGKVIGHNGRHRIRALEKAGIESVEIEVQFFDDEGYLIKYNAKTIPDIAISSQFDTAIETHLSSVIPLNEAHRTEIEKAYGEKAHANAGVKYSKRVTDKKTIDFLENQEHITTYKAMQLIDGKLYPPMAAKVKGADGKYRLSNPSQLGVWQQATEDPSNIKIKKNGVGYYTLNKGNGKSVDAAYNPYEHSSNLVLNDQFEEAYQRDNLVTVECVIPKSEMTSGYHAEYAKDSTGVMDWKAGVVAGKLKNNKRKVYLSRWLKPVRILSEAETAAMYKDIIGTEIAVPFNVVPPSLLKELEKVGVQIDYEGSPMYKSRQNKKTGSNSKRNAREVTERDVRDILDNIENYDKDSYFPVRINTPEVLIEAAKSRGDVIENLPIVMQVKKAQQAMSDDVFERRDPRGHGLSTDDIIAILRAMDTPTYIIYQKNGRYAEIVRFETENKKRAIAILEIGENKNAIHMNGYEGGLYQVLVTAFSPDSYQYIKDILDNKENIILPIAKKKGSSQRSSGSHVPSLLNELPFFDDNVPQKTDSVKNNSENSDIKRSKRDSGDRSNRSLLVNALESTAQNDIEKNKLAQYKSKIELINSEEQKLQDINKELHDLLFTKGRRDADKIRKLQLDKKQTENRINTYDRQLLTLEASKPLKAVLEREKKLAYKKAQEKGKKSLAEYREKSAQRTRELIEQWQESRKKAIEGRHKTEMRHKIKNVVSELNKLLLRPTKDKHIKEELQKAVAEALYIINMDTVGAEERVAKYNELIAKTNDPAMIDELTLTRDRIQLQGETLKDKLDALRTAYEKIKDSEDVEISNSYQEVILNSIKNVSEIAGNTPIKYMTYEQLEAVYEMYSMVLHAVRTANKMFKAKKGETITQVSEAVNDEVRKVGGEHYKRSVIKAALQKIGWTFLKPFTAFRAIGSNTLTGLYKNLRSGEDTYYVDIKEAQTFIQDQYNKHGFKSWDMKKTKEFTAKSGKTFKLTLEQMMSLYAYSRREQALAHILEGGIVFEDAVITEKNKLGIPVKYEVNTKSAFNISEETLNDIIDSLSAEQKAFVEEMQAYLSNEMGAKGNEVSMELLGVKLFKEKFYFPLKSSNYYMGFKPEQAGEIKLKNPSFSKETVKHANNPVVLSDFTDVWANHVNDMSMYHSFVLPLEDFTRVFNYKTKTAANVETISTESTIANAYGDGATKYIRNFLKSLNGGVRIQGTPVDKLIGLTKKGAVLASASVTIQQPSAVMRAMAYINPIYFAKATPQSLNLVHHKKAWEELKKYAPIAGIKEMGHFDIGLGQSTVDWIKSQKNLKDKADDVLTKAPAYMDEVTWVSIWNAVKKEVTAKNKDLQVGSDAFLEKCGERFTEVVSLSQVYDSVFSRSDLMRNANPLAKMLTAFMAEPTTTLNMLIDSWIQGKRTGNFGGFAKVMAKTGGAVVSAIVFNSILKSIIMAMRDDDEDETYTEKYFEHLVGDLKDNLNPLTLIPVVKDIVSIFNGYDVERMDMALFSDLKNAMDAFDSDNKTVYEKWSGLVGAISAFFGVPVKNVERDVRGFINTIKSFNDGRETTSGGIRNALKEGWTGKETSKTQELYDAYLSGDKAQIKRVEGRFETQSDIDSALRKALRDNDPRIRKAAQAVIDENPEERVRITREIIAEGHFTSSIVIGAINAELTALKRELK